MATAKDYADWIVKNPDKKGTPEFNTVAKAYQAAKSQQAPTSSLMHTGETGLNSIYKGLGQGIDAVLNTPQNIANLGVAGLGNVAMSLGFPKTGEKLSEYILPVPDYARRGMEATGLIRKDVKPQGTFERIVDVGGQAVGGALLTPSNSMSGLARNLGLSGFGGAIGQGTKEATGSDIAGALASIAAPVGLTSRAPSARTQIANLAEREASNVARDEITKKGLEQGYVLPPSQVRPSGLNKTIESIGGKAATRQEAEIRNQEVTNRLAKEQIGLKPNEPLTEGALEKLRNNFAAPYREVAAIPEFKSASVMLSRVDPITNQPIAQTVNPKQILEDLKTTRADANAYYKAYSRDAHPETKAKADQFKNQANQLESQLEKIAVLSNKPDLVNQLKEARKKIAQTYTVEQALNVGTTNVDARAIGRAIDKGVPLTENLQLIGNFAEQNPLYVRETSNVSTPGVSALDATVAGMSVAAGKPLAGGIILAKGPARALALSKWYQNWNAKPNYSPSAIAKALQGLTPTERNFALTRMAQLRLQKDDAGQQ